MVLEEFKVVEQLSRARNSSDRNAGKHLADKRRSLERDRRD